MAQSMDWWKGRISEGWETNGEILNRHTRHFAELRENRSQEFWRELKGWASENFDMDVEEVADRGIEYRKEHEQET